MRVSADKNDVAFRAGVAAFCEVYLDGEKLDLCVTADEERGEAICLVRDTLGRVVADGDALLREARRGSVEVRFTPDAPAWLKDELLG